MQMYSGQVEKYGKWWRANAIQTNANETGKAS